LRRRERMPLSRRGQSEPGDAARTDVEHRSWHTLRSFPRQRDSGSMAKGLHPGFRADERKLRCAHSWSCARASGRSARAARRLGGAMWECAHSCTKCAHSFARIRPVPRETSTVEIHEQACGIAQAVRRGHRRRVAVNQRLIDLARIMLRCGQRSVALAASSGWRATQLWGACDDRIPRRVWRAHAGLRQELALRAVPANGAP
jgi:hypothetical protein